MTPEEEAFERYREAHIQALRLIKYEQEGKPEDYALLLAVAEHKHLVINALVELFSVSINNSPNKARVLNDIDRSLEKLAGL